VIAMMTFRVCTRCKRPLPVDEFARNASRRDGRNSHCRDCNRLDVAESRARRGSKSERQYARAKWRALSALADRHADEFYLILEDELVKERGG